MARIRQLSITLLFLNFSNTVKAQPGGDPAQYWEANSSDFHYKEGGMPMRLFNLKGRVKTLSQMAFDADEKGRKGKFVTGSVSFSLAFDSNKHIAEIRYYHAPGIVSHRWVYSDYSQGREDSCHSYNTDGALLYVESKEYDSFGICIDEIMRNVQGEEKHAGWTISRQHDTTIVEKPAYYAQETYERGWLVASTSGNMQPGRPGYNHSVDNFTYFPGGARKTRVRKLNGRLLEVLEFDEAGRLLSRTSYEYRDTVCLSQTTIEHHYDSEGLLRESREVREAKNGRIERVKDYTYRNRRLIKVKYRDGSVSDTNTYNEHGDPLFDKSISDDAACKYTQCDSRGNWLRQTIVVDGKPYRFLERQIGYFD